MRLPAVTIAAAFACGIVLGLQPAAVHHASSATFLLSSFSLTALFVFVGIPLARFNRLFPALAASLLSWVLLGFLGACIAEQSLSADHLRDEPAPIPWGTGYGIELSGVEFEGALWPARGGLRLSFAPRPQGGLPAPLHAGDEVSVLPEARQPQVFRDEGAFDRRAYLAQQNIDLVATLRAPELIERVRLRTPN
jgi:hypothetical protein